MTDPQAPIKFRQGSHVMHLLGNPTEVVPNVAAAAAWIRALPADAKLDIVMNPNAKVVMFEARWDE